MKRKQSSVLERRHKIINLLSDKQTLLVSELSHEMNVSELTIRRDLDMLSADGLIKRIHGGAMLAAESAQASVFNVKNKTHLKEKQYIAAYIATIINDGDTVFLNAGTTTMEIIRKIKGKHVVVVTNNALACTEIHTCNASLISTGGEFNEHNQSYTGLMAASIIQKMNASICILGVNGFTAEDGITTSNYMETMINEEMLKRCKGMRIVATDSSKIGKIFNFSTAPISEINLLVTDSGVDPNELQQIRNRGVEVILADTIGDIQYIRANAAR